MKEKKIIIKKAIERIQENSKRLAEINKLGVELHYEYDSTDDVIRLISYIINKDDIPGIKELIYWWLYEDVDKILYINGEEHEVEELDDFIDLLIYIY